MRKKDDRRIISRYEMRKYSGNMTDRWRNMGKTISGLRDKAMAREFWTAQGAHGRQWWFHLRKNPFLRIQWKRMDYEPGNIHKR